MRSYEIASYELPPAEGAPGGPRDPDGAAGPRDGGRPAAWIAIGLAVLVQGLDRFFFELHRASDIVNGLVPNPGDGGFPGPGRGGLAA